ncbi:MAG: protease modulator HflC [Verrucomicrobiota bacterium]
MTRNRINLAVGLVLMLVFILLLFAFQVRQTEVAVVTTFGAVTREYTNAGFKLKWPWPIQQVTKLDKRVQNYESKFEETLTKDGRNLLVTVYAGWTIANPAVFFPSFANGSISEAEHSLEGLIRSKKNEVIGQHAFSDFINTDPKQLKFTEIENEILQKVRGEATTRYGVEVQFLGIKRLGLPESITQKVFDRMQAERQRLVQQFQGEGESKSIEIRTTADRDRDKILAEAEAEATRIRGEGDAEAARAFEVFQKNPDLAILLLKLGALEQSLKEKSTLILDQNTPPFDLLKNVNPTDRK